MYYCLLRFLVAKLITRLRKKEVYEELFSSVYIYVYFFGTP